MRLFQAIHVCLQFTELILPSNWHYTYTLKSKSSVSLSTKENPKTYHISEVPQRHIIKVLKKNSLSTINNLVEDILFEQYLKNKGQRAYKTLDTFITIGRIKAKEYKISKNSSPPQQGYSFCLYFKATLWTKPPTN